MTTVAWELDRPDIRYHIDRCYNISDDTSIMRYCELRVPILRNLGTRCSFGLNISHPQDSRLQTISQLDVVQVPFVSNVNFNIILINETGLNFWVLGIPDVGIDNAFCETILARKIRNLTMIFLYTIYF